MSKNNNRSLSKHNRLVKKKAEELKRKGHNVKADHLKGYDQPKKIGKDNRIPDIEATKNGRKQIIEVEKEKPSEAEKEQASTFRRSAAQQKKTSFKQVRYKNNKK